MKRAKTNIFIFAMLLVGALPFLPARAQTITFDDQGYVHNAGLGQSITVGNFTFSVVNQTLAIDPENEQMYYESSSEGNGFAGSGLIYVGDQFDFDDPYYFRIQVSDGTNRHLSSFYIYDYINAAGKDKISITVEGFRDNVKVGEQDFNLIGDGVSKQVLSLNTTIFSDVDEVRIRQFQPFAYGAEYPGLVFAFDQFVFEEALPVRLAAFGAQKTENGIEVFWETATETGSAYFDVERSTDARSWERIARLDAKGESDQSVHYHFRDEGPVQEGRYYRLKMVDADSSFAYSKIEHVAADKRRGIVMYPNPAISSVTVRNIDSPISSAELLDDDGRRMESFPSLLPVRGEITLPLPDITPGTYWLRIHMAGGVFETKKLVKAK
ncbi:T9SS type A sorting domain-containing protein [Dyadobacter sp. 676]|uniref:T9SS type A sorting domain-containing protein n=1 Tax=Dyadobacter sp. 676 TaxID=3088362 RepID=A0AAU8FLZ7_9BACT